MAANSNETVKIAAMAIKLYDFRKGLRAYKKINKNVGINTPI